MTHTPQLKGRAHIDYIRSIAICYWAKTNWLPGMYPVCLRDAMKEHREYLIRCEQEKKKIADEQREAALKKYPKCKECFTPLDQNDIFHYGQCCRDCFHARMNGETGRNVNNTPVAPVIPTPRLPKPRMLGPLA